MQILRVFIATLISTRCITSYASWAKIVGYSPTSKVTSQSAIDLDQKAIEDALGQPTINYQLVKNLYEQGGNSDPYAEFHVPPLQVGLHKGDMVKGKRSGKTGSIYEDHVAQSTTIKVAYSTSEVQSVYVGCKGGALPQAPPGTIVTAIMTYIMENDCFNGTSPENLEITTTDLAGQPATIEILPHSIPKNKAGRTLQHFSKFAGGMMYLKGRNGGCAGASDRPTDGCPYADFSEYFNYYGNYDYADKLVLAAIDGAHTSFKNAAGQMNFMGSNDKIRAQIIKKGTAYMNAYMYAIREFEDAIDDCLARCTSKTGKDCDPLASNAAHAWDQGVAFYTGSLEGHYAGGTSAGKMMYRLAEKRCVNFKTCGPKGGSTSGVSQVNTELFRQIDIGQLNLLQGKCAETRPILRKMVALMSVPLIQGTLRYAHRVDKLGGDDRHKAEGAVFAASIVPRVAACSSADAKVIMDNMKIDVGSSDKDHLPSSTDFAAVKKAFENNYECMEITCEHVGGLWFDAENKYYEGAEPCGKESTETYGFEGGTRTNHCAPHSGMFSMGNLITLLIACFCFLHS